MPPDDLMTKTEALKRAREAVDEGVRRFGGHRAAQVRARHNHLLRCGTDVHMDLIALENRLTRQSDWLLANPDHDKFAAREEAYLANLAAYTAARDEMDRALTVTSEWLGIL